jgi:hypothetical protein
VCINDSLPCVIIFSRGSMLRLAKRGVVCALCSMERVCDYSDGRFLLQKYFANTSIEASIK